MYFREKIQSVLRAEGHAEVDPNFYKSVIAPSISSSENSFSSSWKNINLHIFLGSSNGEEARTKIFS